ncbi:hypothetical protein ACPPVO_33475 [Dactylosporangium sp. McL0621]|uniref:hypothetical protein n=1 Tax=Dactylosporangium sp. McL0621 TaxID=3415678 RepID=UPI003CF9372F
MNSTESHYKMLVAMVGPAGIGLGAVIMFLIGNSISGVTSAPEMLPAGFGTPGQLFPADAGGTLLRSTSSFDGAAASRSILVLITWMTAGLLPTALGRRIRPASRRALAGQDFGPTSQPPITGRRGAQNIRISVQRGTRRTAGSRRRAARVEHIVGMSDSENRSLSCS